MNLRAFSKFNVARSNSWHKLDSWSLSDWMTALVGEVGEAANIIKKLNRVRDGLHLKQATEEELKSNLADEIADAFIYLDLLASRAGLDLSEIVAVKFNKTSDKQGVPYYITYDIESCKYEFEYPVEK